MIVNKPRLTWEPGRFNAQTGYIYGEAEKYKAKIETFSISYTTDRADIVAGTPYLLAHRLPFRGIERKFGSMKLAQEHAERYLVWAMRLMGFEPIDKEDDGS
jgi:hypothetical protein